MGGATAQVALSGETTDTQVTFEKSRSKRAGVRGWSGCSRRCSHVWVLVRLRTGQRGPTPVFPAPSLQWLSACCIHSSLNCPGKWVSGGKVPEDSPCAAGRGPAGPKARIGSYHGFQHEAWGGPQGLPEPSPSP